MQADRALLPQLPGRLVPDGHFQTSRLGERAAVRAAQQPLFVQGLQIATDGGGRDVELLGQAGDVDTAVLDHAIEDLGESFCFHARSVRVRFRQNEHICATIRKEAAA